MRSPGAAEVAEGGEQPPKDAPRVYVASLSDYNAGRLHGDWINAAREVKEIHADVTAMLARSRETGAEEWAIHDYDGFGPLRLGEHESLDVVAAIARGIASDGDAFAAFAYSLGSPSVEQLERFDERYRGHWPSLTDYADDLLEDLGTTQVLELIPAWLQPYVSLDVRGFGRDLALGGDLLAIGSEDGGVHIFDAGAE